MPTPNTNHRIPKVCTCVEGDIQFTNEPLIGNVIPGPITGRALNIDPVDATVTVTKENSIVVISAWAVRLDANGGSPTISIIEDTTTFVTRTLIPLVSGVNPVTTTLLHIISNPTIGPHNYQVTGISNDISEIIAGMSISAVVIEPLSV